MKTASKQLAVAVAETMKWGKLAVHGFAIPTRLEVNLDVPSVAPD